MMTRDEYELIQSCIVRWREREVELRKENERLRAELAEAHWSLSLWRVTPGEFVTQPKQGEE